MSAKKVLAQLYFASLLIAARVTHFAQLRCARPCSATGSPLIPGQNPIFQTPPEKNDLANDPLQGRSLLKQVKHREKPNVL